MIRKLTWLNIKENTDMIRGRVLDVGCGTMPYKDLIEGHSTSYTGLDIDPLLSSVSGNIVIYDGQMFPFNDSDFDTAVSFHVLQYVRNVPLLLKEIRRVLIPGGRFIMCIPSVWPVYKDDLNRFTFSGLERLLQDAGFRIIKFIRGGSTVETIAQLLGVYIKRESGAHLLPRIAAAAMLLPVMLLLRALGRRLLASNSSMNMLYFIVAENESKLL